MLLASNHSKPSDSDKDQMTDQPDIRTQFEAWMDQHGGDSGTPPIAAATVILLRDSDDGPEVLLMHRNSTIAFGGAWVFPGGKLDPGDYDPDDTNDVLTASRNAAVRESLEEGGITIEVDELVEHSHWMPPPIAPKRFSTWFFIARATEEDVVVDESEITEHDWMRPLDALAQQAERKIELAPPTWVTLHKLGGHASVADALAATAAQTVPFYLTQVGRLGDDPVAMWHGDAGYEARDPNLAGARHRLVMQRGGWKFEHND